MDGFRTLGQPGAVSAVRAMLDRGAVPHAVLLAGPGGTGKTTLALDLAAGLLCVAPDPALRPCRTCRPCRMVGHGNHPDLHHLAPEGAGNLIGIGGIDRGRGVRDLAAELALMPVEGGARVAIVTPADRMTEEAQSALLKTLEEPPAGTTVILCADEEDRLLPTIRSRCARIRLGPVGSRTIEAILADRQVADPPTAARLARVSGGRPGLALAWALAPAASARRAEIARRLLDLASDGRTGRLRGARELLAATAEMLGQLDLGRSTAERTAGALAAAVADADRSGPGNGGAVRPSRRSRSGGSAPGGSREPDATGEQADPDAPASTRASAADRRRAAVALVELWRDVARDLLLVERGDPRSVRDIGLLDDLAAVAAGPHPEPGAFLGRLERAGALLDGNASPELVVDVLALAWAPAPARR